MDIETIYENELAYFEGAFGNHLLYAPALLEQDMEFAQTGLAIYQDYHRAFGGVGLFFLIAERFYTLSRIVKAEGSYAKALKREDGLFMASQVRVSSLVAEASIRVAHMSYPLAFQLVDRHINTSFERLTGAAREAHWNISHPNPRRDMLIPLRELRIRLHCAAADALTPETFDAPDAAEGV